MAVENDKPVAAPWGYKRDGTPRKAPYPKTLAPGSGGRPRGLRDAALTLTHHGKIPLEIALELAQGKGREEGIPPSVRLEACKFLIEAAFGPIEKQFQDRRMDKVPDIRIQMVNLLSRDREASAMLTESVEQALTVQAEPAN